MTKKYSYLILILIIGFLVLLIYLPKSQSPIQEQLFFIQKGESSREIAFNLEKQGFINFAPLFRIYVLFAGISDKLQAGAYLISSSMSISEIAGKFAKGEIAKINITIPEGFTAEQIYQKLAGSTQVDLADLENNEGYLFPDTYEISYGFSSQEIVKLMRENFDKKTADFETIPEIIIMASILEKEVKTKEEKEMAAGILWKRLKIGMALQVDAAPETYQKKGLPENPICNPGLESIKAAIYPKESPYWYYLSKPDGTTVFSKTLEEHNIARAKYLK